MIAQATNSEMLTGFSGLITGGIGGGVLVGLVVALTKFLGKHEDKLWTEVARLNTLTIALNTQVNSNQMEIIRLRDARHDLDSELQAARLQIDVLQLEVNELYAQNGKPPKYPGIGELISSRHKASQAAKAVHVQAAYDAMHPHPTSDQ